MNNTHSEPTGYFDMTTQLLGVIGRLGLLIRLSAQTGGKQPDGSPNQINRNLYWLGDALHNLGHVYELLSGDRTGDAAQALQRQISDIQDYLDTEADAAFKAVAVETLKPLESLLEQMPRKQ